MIGIFDRLLRCSGAATYLGIREMPPHESRALAGRTNIFPAEVVAGKSLNQRNARGDCPFNSVGVIRFF